MKKVFVLGLALAIAVPGTGFAQSAGAQPQQHGERPGKQNSQPAATAGKEPDKKKTSAPSSSDHPFTRGARFSRSKAPNYRRVNYRESSRLSAPPSGQVWVRAGADALLVRLSDNIVVRVTSDVF